MIFYLLKPAAELDEGFKTVESIQLNRKPPQWCPLLLLLNLPVFWQTHSLLIWDLVIQGTSTRLALLLRNREGELDTLAQELGAQSIEGTEHGIHDDRSIDWLIVCVSLLHQNTKTQFLDLKIDELTQRERKRERVVFGIWFVRELWKEKVQYIVVRKETSLCFPVVVGLGWREVAWMLWPDWRV